jgi:predicted ATP-grasp superfamily ATP-dependent carboligase
VPPIPNLLILGASVRAAAFSALRAGLVPWGADLFSDTDLIASCPCVRLAAPDYPDGFLQVLRNAPAASWMYTGALENRPALIRTLSRLRPLWGNDCQVVRKVRSPFAVEHWLCDHNIPCPRHQRPGALLAPDCRWLVKPLTSAGGRGIGFCPRASATPRSGKVYFQEFIEGDSCAAVYVGDGRDAVLLGVTRQLLGESWLNAAPFHYCGSVGPLPLSDGTHSAFDRLGQVLAAGFQLRGVFGVDCILRDGVPYPVEINPRYTASVEVVEYATGLRSLALHRDGLAGWRQQPKASPLTKIVGKAILFARQAVVFPASGPWRHSWQLGRSIQEMPAFADIPQVGVRTEPRQPLLTFFAQADSVPACVAELRQIARDLDRWLRRR